MLEEEYHVSVTSNSYDYVEPSWYDNIKTDSNSQKYYSDINSNYELESSLYNDYSNISDLGSKILGITESDIYHLDKDFYDKLRNDRAIRDSHLNDMFSDIVSYVESFLNVFSLIPFKHPLLFVLSKILRFGLKHLKTRITQHNNGEIFVSYRLKSDLYREMAEIGAGSLDSLVFDTDNAGVKLRTDFSGYDLHKELTLSFLLDSVGIKRLFKEHIQDNQDLNTLDFETILNNESTITNINVDKQDSYTNYDFDNFSPISVKPKKDITPLDTEKIKEIADSYKNKLENPKKELSDLKKKYDIDLIEYNRQKENSRDPYNKLPSKVRKNYLNKFKLSIQKLRLSRPRYLKQKIKVDSIKKAKNKDIQELSEKFLDNCMPPSKVKETLDNSFSLSDDDLNINELIYYQASKRKTTNCCIALSCNPCDYTNQNFIRPPTRPINGGSN